MKKKEGFIAISLIYSFFLVFLMLMVSILGKSVNNRVLVGSIKSDIREDIASQTGFIVDTIANRAYSVGEIVSFANEEWRVMQNKSGSIVLILNRSLTKNEMELNLGRDANNHEYYGVCNDTSCQLRMCRSAFSGEEYCYIYSANTRLHRIPAWAPTMDQIRNFNFGQSIPSAVVQSWFRNHQGLQKVLNQSRLVKMSFSDGGISNDGYVRLPLSSEITNASSYQNPSPFHLLDKNNDIQTKIYNGSALQIVSSDTAAYVRPVIEVKKGNELVVDFDDDIDLNHFIVDNSVCKFCNKKAQITIENGKAKFFTPAYDNFVTLKTKTYSSITSLSFSMAITNLSTSAGTTFWIPDFHLTLSNGQEIYVYPIHYGNSSWNSYLPVPGYPDGFVIVNNISGEKIRLNARVGNGYYAYAINVDTNNNLTIRCTTCGNNYSYTYNIGDLKLASVTFNPLNSWWGTNNSAEMDWIRITAQ